MRRSKVRAFGVVGSGVIAGDCNATVTAAGSSATDATQLTAEINRLTTVGASTGVRLWTPEPGDKCWLYNSSGTTALIYPATGGSINASAASLSFPTAKSCVLVADTAIHWTSFPLVPS